jgi:hypothetical protein
LKQLQEDAAFEIQWREQRRGDFLEWVTNTEPDEEWPIALIGPTKRPVDLWATLRGDVHMRGTDRARWMTAKQYVDAMRVSIGMSAAATPHEPTASTQPNLEAFLLHAPVFETWQFHWKGRGDFPTDARGKSMDNAHVVCLTLRAYMDALEAAADWKKGNALAADRRINIETTITQREQDPLVGTRHRS